MSILPSAMPSSPSSIAPAADSSIRRTSAGDGASRPPIIPALGFFGPDEGIDVLTNVAIDALGYVYVGGYATSTEFPLVDSMQTVNPDGDD